MTHVWLLPPGERRVSVLDRWLAWIFPPPKTLAGPTTDDELAHELGRLLGAAYECSAVQSVETTARRVGRNERVILVPSPDGSEDPLARAMAALGPIRVELVTAPPPLSEPAMIEALAETIREGVLALAGADYAVLFCADARCDARRIVPQLIEATRITRPWRLVYSAPRPWGSWRLRSSLRRLAAPAVLAVPLTAVRDLELDALAPRVVRAPALGTRPTYVRALKRLVERAEGEAGWSSSASDSLR
jgi:hypothetical protein